MKRLFLPLLIACAALPAAAKEPGKAADPVREELSRVSGLKESELNAVLKDCKANQRAMYFCAWRDKIAAEHDVRAIIGQKKTEDEKCGATLDARFEKWMQARDGNCSAQARKEWEGGSMQPTAQLICSAMETTRMTRRLQMASACSAFSQPGESKRNAR